MYNSPPMGPSSENAPSVSGGGQESESSVTTTLRRNWLKIMPDELRMEIISYLGDPLDILGAVYGLHPKMLLLSRRSGYSSTRFSDPVPLSPQEYRYLALLWSRQAKWWRGRAFIVHVHSGSVALEVKDRDLERRRATETDAETESGGEQTQSPPPTKSCIIRLYICERRLLRETNSRWRSSGGDVQTMFVGVVYWIGRFLREMNVHVKPLLQRIGGVELSLVLLRRSRTRLPAELILHSCQQNLCPFLTEFEVRDTPIPKSSSSMNLTRTSSSQRLDSLIFSPLSSIGSLERRRYGAEYSRRIWHGDSLSSSSSDSASEDGGSSDDTEDEELHHHGGAWLATRRYQYLQGLKHLALMINDNDPLLRLIAQGQWDSLESIELHTMFNVGGLRTRNALSYLLDALVNVPNLVVEVYLDPWRDAPVTWRRVISLLTQRSSTRVFVGVAGVSVDVLERAQHSPEAFISVLQYIDYLAINLKVFLPEPTPQVELRYFLYRKDEPSPPPPSQVDPTPHYYSLTKRITS